MMLSSILHISFNLVIEILMVDPKMVLQEQLVLQVRFNLVIEILMVDPTISKQYPEIYGAFQSRNRDSYG